MRIQNKLILLVSLYIPFTNIKGIQANRLNFGLIWTLREFSKLKSTYLGEFLRDFKNSKKNVITFVWVIDFCNVEVHSIALGRRNIDREAPATPGTILYSNL